MKGKELYRKELAEKLKAHAGELYRPSNGTEGMIFQEHYCSHCSKADEYGDCKIFYDTMYYDVKDEKYPREWIYDLDGQPTCTAFAEEKK